MKAWTVKMTILAELTVSDLISFAIGMALCPGIIIWLAIQASLAMKDKKDDDRSPPPKHPYDQ